MTKLNSDRPTGDFLKFSHMVGYNLHTYRVIPNIIDNNIPVNLARVMCIDLVKNSDANDISIHVHGDSNAMPAQDGYSLEPVSGKLAGIDVGKVSNIYILTNTNGHLYIPMASKSLLYDMTEFLRNMTGYTGIRMIPYHEQHDLNSLANTTKTRRNEIRRPKIEWITVHVDGKPTRKKTEKDHPEKDSEFDQYVDRMFEMMREYPSRGIYSVYLFSSIADDAFVQRHSFDTSIQALDRLQFIPVKPLKKKTGWIKKVEVDPIDVIGTPLFFNVADTTKRCTKRYYSDSIIHHRQHSPIICGPSDLNFPFSHTSIIKTAPTKRIAEKVNEEDMFGGQDKNSSDDVIDEDFFESVGSS